MINKDRTLLDTCGRTGEEFIKELFEYEYCSECKRDAEDHTAVPLVFGDGNFCHWFARCNKEPAIVAEIWSDDRIREARFDATPWFEQASDEEIVKLHSCGFSYSYEADDVAIFCSSFNKDIELVLDYVTPIKDLGFEVEVDIEDAMSWIENHKPHLLEILILNTNTRK